VHSNELGTRCELVEAAALSTVAELMAGGSAVLQAARAKLLGAELCQAIPRQGLALLGSDAMTGDDELAFLWRASIHETSPVEALKLCCHLSLERH